MLIRFLDMTDGDLDWIEYPDAWSTGQCSWQDQQGLQMLHTHPLHLHTPPVSLYPLQLGRKVDDFLVKISLLSLITPHTVFQQSYSRMLVKVIFNSSPIGY